MTCVLPAQVQMDEFANESVLLLQDEENHVETNEADGYDVQHIKKMLMKLKIKN